MLTCAKKYLVFTEREFMSTEKGFVENNDIRSKRTRTAILNAMLELLENKSFEKITIQNICDVAGISRTAFYLYFEDKYDLIVECIKFFVVGLMNKYTYKELTEFNNELLTFLMDNKLAIESLQKYNLGMELQNKMHAMFLELYENYYNDMEEHGEKISGIKKLVSVYNFQAVNGLIYWWIAMDYPVPKDLMVEYIVKKILQTD